MLEKNLYNGWTNYETWRIMLEVVDGLDLGENATWSEINHAVELVCYDGVEHASLAESLITAFLAEVNWRELADAHNEKY
jgi:hypothetical protein